MLKTFFRCSKSTSNSNSFLNSCLLSNIPRRHFYSFFKKSPTSGPATLGINKIGNNLQPTHSVNTEYVQKYMAELHRYLANAALVGICSAELVAVGAPLGASSALLVLAGFGMDFYGKDYVEKTKSQVAIYKDNNGNINHVSVDPPMRKLALTTMCIGQGSILGFMIGMAPFSGSILPLSLLTCLFSTLGHFIYNKLPLKKYRPRHLFTIGTMTGMLGLSLVNAGVLLPLGLNISMQGLEFSTYFGLFLYNMFAKYDSQKALEDINNGKGDCLKHATLYSENWLCTLFPHFLMNALSSV